MALDAAALLDELMGKNRDAAPGDDTRDTNWWDAEVCKHYLCGFCPSELFTNTKSDIGICYKTHDEKLKKTYEESDRKGRMGYEAEFLEYLEKIIRDLDRRITRGKERLRKSADAKQQVLSGDGGVSSERMKRLNMDINATVLELEQLGAMGRVEEAQSLMRRVEDLERERERERMALTSDTPKTLAGFEVDANDFHEKMELCDVCGSFLVIGDTQSRVDAHLLGKQHMGYARIRAAVTELMKMRETRWRQRDEVKRRIRERSRSREREKRRSRHSRSRSRERYRRASHRSRSRSRERKDRRRSQSRERKDRRRSQSRERKDRRRSQSRERKDRRRSQSRERKDRLRSQSGERKDRRRSRSRSRERKDRRRSQSREREKQRERKGSQSQEKPTSDEPKEATLENEPPVAKGEKEEGEVD